MRALATSAHDIFVEYGCTSYVKTIYVGYDHDGEMVAALYGHSDHVEIALALPEDAEGDILVATLAISLGGLCPSQPSFGTCRRQGIR